MMLVANSFDLWQRDAFFSAAEEVQESTDILESAYRTWLREKREQSSLCDLEDLRRELQTALGTAKWQLEEFERAVRLSYGNCRDQNRMARHQQFVVAIENQISQVEDALRESLNEEGKQPLQWVNLDEDERDDLAMFLSGSSEYSTKSTRDESVKSSICLEMESLYKRKDLDYAACNTSSSSSMEFNTRTKGLASFRNDVVINMGLPNCTAEVGAREALGTRGDVSSEVDRASSTKRTRGSPKLSASKLMIRDEDDQMKILMPTADDTSKEKRFRTSNFLCLRDINGITKLFKGASGMNSRLQSRQRIQLSSSLRLIIVLMFSCLLFGSFLLSRFTYFGDYKTKAITLWAFHLNGIWCSSPYWRYKIQTLLPTFCCERNVRGTK